MGYWVPFPYNVICGLGHQPIPLFTFTYGTFCLFAFCDVASHGLDLNQVSPRITNGLIGPLLPANLAICPDGAMDLHFNTGCSRYETMKLLCNALPIVFMDK